MGSYLFEVKSILRSILISSPVIINVNQLNKDFREQEGIAIPFEKFGHKNLLEFLKSIPDVLLVNGDSKYSEVTLISSEKSSHVNDLVMKQKFSPKPGSFSAHKSRKIVRKSFKRYEKSVPEVRENSRQDDGYFSTKTSSVTSKKNMEEVESEKTDFSKSISVKEHLTKQQKYQISPSSTIYDTKFNYSKESMLQDNLKSPHQHFCSINYSSAEHNVSSDFIQNTITPNNRCTKNINTWTESYSNKKSVRKKLNRASYKNNQNVDSPTSSSFFELDISLRESKKKGDYNHPRGELISVPKRENKTFAYCGEVEKEFQNNGELNCFGRSVRQTLSRRDTKNNGKCRTYELKKNSKIQRKVQNYIPETVHSNLQKLISDFPEGIYCSELPTVYKNLIGEELRFEDYGYMYLVYMCLDLNNIFHCVKESSSDYKLYDARNPLPQCNSSNYSGEISEEDDCPEPTSAIPEMLWGCFETFLPEDAIKPGFEIERIQVSDVLSAGISVNVTVADIYDISKFWIIIDYPKFEYMMDNMQTFYKDNNRYLVPKSILEVGLCCVVLYRETFHRAVILKLLPGEDYLKVYYFDYGTLGTVPKSEVWFLTRTFSELPRQAIRSRLFDICPPYSGITWSSSAFSMFSNLTCMKKLVAEIERVDKTKNLVDIKLRNDQSYISDILVDLGHAIFINQTPKKHIEDPHCKPRVQYPHLFPTFEEIENWVVPSTAEADFFSKTSVTVDFLYSQYFSRTSYKELIESIERKNIAMLKKRKSLVKQFRDTEEGLVFKNEDEINRLLYGGLYFKKTHTQDDEEIRYQEQENNNVVHTEVFDIEDDGALIGLLRQRRMKKIDLLETRDKDVDILQTILDERNSNNSAKLGCETNSSVIDNSLHPKSDNAILDCQEMPELKNVFPKDGSAEETIEPFANLIDLDVDISPPIESSMNLLSYPEFAESQLALERSKNYQRCLLTDDSFLTDVDRNALENILDEPIPEVTNSIPSVDLIHFDTDESSPAEVLSLDAINEDSKSHEDNISNSESGDADDEDSDSKLNNIESPNCSISRKKLIAMTNSLNLSEDSYLPALNGTGMSQERIIDNLSFNIVKVENEANDGRMYSETDLDHEREQQINDHYNFINDNQIVCSNFVNSKNMFVQNDLFNNENIESLTTEILEKPSDTKLNAEHHMEWQNMMKLQNYELGQPQQMELTHLDEFGDMNKHSGTLAVGQSQPMRVMPFAGYYPVPIFGNSRVLYPFTNQSNYPHVPNIPIPLPPFSHQQQFLSEVGQIHKCPPVVIFNYNIFPQNEPYNHQ